MIKNYVHKDWYGWFEYVGNHQSNDRAQEIKWIAKMRWNDPRLLNWAKDDLEGIGKEVFDRIFYYVEKNNIDSLNLVFDQYKSSGVMEFMRTQCNEMNNTDTEMHCKLANVFESLTGLMKDNADIAWDPTIPNNRPPRNREELAMLYLLQPEVYKVMNIGGSVPRNKTLCYRLMTMFPSFFENTLAQNGQAIKEHFGKFGSVYVSLKSACNETYNNDFENIVCYIAETFYRMDKLTTALGPDFNNWDSSESQTMRAIVLIWHLLTPKANFYVKTTDLKRVQSGQELLKIMYTKIRGNELDDLQEMASLIPNEKQMGLTSSELCSPNFDEISTYDMRCGFNIVLENLALFLGQYSSKDRITKRIDLSVDHKARLQLFQISSIKDTVQNSKLELKASLNEFSRDLKTYMEASMGNRFASLQHYFDSMASFDLEIAKADTAYITGKLDDFTKTSNDLNEKLAYESSKLQTEVLIIKSIDAVFMWMKAIASGISAVLGAFTGDFGGMADAADRIDAAARTTLEAVQAGAIKEQIGITTDTYKEIAIGLTDNRGQLDNVKKVIDKLKEDDVSSDEFKNISKNFIQSYNDYTPRVSAAQIAKLDTAWSEVVDNLESIMDSMTTKESIVLSTKSFAENHFFKIKLVVPQLSETLSNRFDFQFDLMDSLAAMVRAHTSLQGAKALSKGYPNLDDELAKSVAAQLVYEQMALSTYVLSQFHLLLILSNYCNYVTYVNAGVESSQCAKALNTMNKAHIDDALSFRPPSCDLVRMNLRIPTSDTGKSDSINLHQLNSGEAVAFRIPSFEWLETNGDLSSNDRTTALFVRSFEVYILTNDTYQIDSNLRVEVTPAGSSPLFLGSDQTRYELLPVSRTQFIFEYKENYRGNCMTERNPYFVCNPGPKGICVQSRGDLSCNNEKGAYPSIYSPWTIRLDENISNAPNPAPGTKLYLQAQLSLCRKTRDSNLRPNSGRKRIFKNLLSSKKRKDENGGERSCPTNKYYNQDTKQFVACPDDSAPQRYNYYCEVNKSGYSG